MKAIILAGGRGSRLGKLTDSLPKVLMEINGTTIIERQIKILNKIGITDITLVTGYGADLIKKKLSAYNVNLIQNEKYSTTDTLYAFWLAKHCMDDEFLSFFGDTVFEEKILLNLLDRKDADICLAVEKSTCNKEDVKVILSNDLITRIEAYRSGSPTTISVHSANAKFIGIAKFTSKGAQILRNTLNNFAKNEELKGDIARTLDVISLQKKCVYAQIVNDLVWFNINRYDDLDMARKYFAGRITD